MSETCWIRTYSQDVSAAVYNWCRHRGIRLIEEDYDCFMSAFAFANAEDEVRWGRALKELMVDVEYEMSSRNLDFEIHIKSVRSHSIILGEDIGRVLSPYRFKHSDWFVKKYPELNGLLE